MARKGVLSDISYTRVATEVKRSGGSVTALGEQRHRAGRGLHDLVNPSGGPFGPIRRSLTRYVEEGGVWVAPNGVAMLLETLFDTTGSMGGNVTVAFEVLPKLYKLLASSPQAVLGRYDLQIITSIFGDVYADDYALQRSHAEMDEKIPEQMRLMCPERDGGDGTEDPEFGLFGATYLTSAMINLYGLRSYHFMLGDADGRGRVEARMLRKEFGTSVFEAVRENGFQIDERNLPTTREVVAELLKRTHAFFLQVEDHVVTTRFWTPIYGKERVIKMPSTRLLPYVQAAIIGLTEGVLDLQSLGAYLKTEGVSDQDARAIARAVAGIPLRAQANLPNFGKVPLAGAKFVKKGDVWPIDPAVTRLAAAKAARPIVGPKDSLWD